MSPECEDLLSGRGIPQTYCLVPAPRRHGLSVQGKGDGSHAAILSPASTTSAEDAKEQNPPAPSRPRGARISLPVPASQRRTVFPPPANASVFPSGEKAMNNTGPPCPRRTRISLPVAASQRRTI